MHRPSGVAKSGDGCAKPLAELFVNMPENPYESPSLTQDNSVGSPSLTRKIICWIGVGAILTSAVVYVGANWLHDRQKSTQYLYYPYVSVIKTVVPVVVVAAVIAIISCRWLPVRRSKSR